MWQSVSVKIEVEEPQLYTVDVTDITFNPSTWVFEHSLKTFDGWEVTPNYWNLMREETNPQFCEI